MRKVNLRHIAYCLFLVISMSACGKIHLPQIPAPPIDSDLSRAHVSLRVQNMSVMDLIILEIGTIDRYGKHNPIFQGEYNYQTHREFPISLPIGHLYITWREVYENGHGYRDQTQNIFPTSRDVRLRFMHCNNNSYRVCLNASKYD